MVCVAQGPVMRRIVRSLDRAMPNSLARAETLRPRILKRHPAVDEVRLSGNIARLIRSQEDGKRRDLLGLAEPAHGLALNEASLHLAHRFAGGGRGACRLPGRSEEHTSELQSRENL